MPPYPCCCGHPVCPNCTNTPTGITVDITGAVDDACSDCTILNDSYSVPQYTPCSWWTQIAHTGVGVGADFPACANDYQYLKIRVWIRDYPERIDCEIELWTIIGGWNERWNFSTTTWPINDCCDWTLEPLDYVDRSGGTQSCDLSSATVEISAATGC